MWKSNRFRRLFGPPLRRARLTRRLSVEPLEERCLLSVDPILEWNEVLLQANVVDHGGLHAPEQGGPVFTARAFAIVSAAMFDAENSIHQRFTPYLTLAPNAHNASVDAAVAQAAHDTLVALFPSQTASFDAALTQTFRRVRDGHQEERGIAVGHLVAQRILSARAHDGSDVPGSYTPTGLPGNHNVDPNHPDQGFYAPAAGAMTPFALPSAEQFRAPPPPALTSAEYALAFNQVKRLGGDGVNTPTLRTAAETEIGIFWGYDGRPGLGVPPRLYNQIARTVAGQQNNAVAENARLFALLNISLADAAIQCWDAKYTYAFWRPVLGIHNADAGGNPLTQADPTWHYLGAPASNPLPGQTNFTPPFPSYTSGHATFGGAALKTLANFYQTDNISFTFTSDELNGATRDDHGNVRPLRPHTFATFSQANAENGASRVFLGIHWRFDQVQGALSGDAIANFVFDHFLQPLHGHGQTAIPDPDIAAQIDDYLAGGNGLPFGPAPAALLAPPAPPSALLADAGLIKGLTAADNALVLTNLPADDAIPSSPPVLTPAADRVEVSAGGLGKRTDAAVADSTITAKGQDSGWRDLVFSAPDFVDRLGELV